MATTKVSALAAKNTLTGNEEILINDSGDSKKSTVTAVRADRLGLSGGTMTGNIAMNGSETVDGRDLSVDGAKLDGIAAGATGTQTITLTGNVTGSGTGSFATTIANDAVTVDKLNLISTGSVPSLEAKGDGSSQDGYIQLNCSQNSHGIKLKSPPHSANASYTLTFPNNDGSANEFLQTNGSGVMTWAAVASGNVTTNGLYEMANTISANYSIASGNNAMSAGPITINSGVSVTVPTGSTWVVA